MRGGRNGDFQVGEFDIQPVEVVALARDGSALPADERRKIQIHRAGHQAQRRQPPRVDGPDAETAQRQHQPKPGQVVVVIVAVPVRASRCTGQNAG